MKKILFALVTFLLVSCQQSLEQLESRVNTSGSTVPRNHRESVIFDYFQALKDERYEDAYKLRAWESSISLDSFIEAHAPNHASLATKISIGGRKKS